MGEACNSKDGGIRIISGGKKAIYNLILKAKAHKSSSVLFFKVIFDW